jgi:hypothetical protein
MGMAEAMAAPAMTGTTPATTAVMPPAPTIPTAPYTGGMYVSDYMSMRSPSMNPGFAGSGMTPATNYVPMRDQTSPTTGVMPADLAPAYDPRLTPEMQRAMRDMNSRVPPEPSIPRRYGVGSADSDPLNDRIRTRNIMLSDYGPGAGMQGATRVMPATGQARQDLSPMAQSIIGGVFGGGLGGLIGNTITGDQVRASRAANAANVSRINVPPMPPMGPGYSYSPVRGAPFAQPGVRQPLVPTMPPSRPF